MRKKGYYFSIDALIALIIIFTVIVTVRPPIRQVTSDMYLQEDLLLVLTSLKIGEINETAYPYVYNDWIPNNYVTNQNLTLLDQIGAFYSYDDGLPGSRSNKLTQDIINHLGAKDKIGLWFDNRMIANSSIYNNTYQVWTSRQLISGIQNGTNVTGFTATASLSSTSRQSYYYFGGYVGDGIIKKKVEYQGSIKNASIEGELVGTFDLSVINSAGVETPAGTYTGSAGQITKINIEPAQNYFTPGVNYVKFNSNDFYISGGFVKLSYENVTSPFSRYKRYNFPGIQGVINLYDSFYVPGTLNYMSIYLNYSSNYTAFLNLGNITIVNQTNTFNTPISLSNSDLLSLGLNYNSLTNETIPLRFGLWNVSYSSSSKSNADVFSVTDLSGSMDGSKISAAKSANKALISAILNESIPDNENRLGLVGYEYSASQDDFHPLTKNNNSLINKVNQWVAEGYTCICCGINKVIGNFIGKEEIYYNFDDNVNDQSGNGNDAAIVGSPSYVSGVDNTALKFDGVDDYVNAHDDNLYYTRSGAISFWFKLESDFDRYSATTQPIWGKYMNNNNNAFIVLRGNDLTSAGRSGAILAKMEMAGEGGGDDYAYSNRRTWDADTWYHLAFVWNSNTMQIYINGVLDRSTSGGQDIGFTGDNEIGRVSFDSSDISGQRYLDGTIDEFRMHNRALNLTEIQQLANNVPVCGDNRIQVGEVCDGNFLGCNSGSEVGTKNCSSDCISYNTCATENKHRTMIVMSDGLANRVCGNTALDYDGDSDTTEDPQDQAIDAACDAFKNYSITVHAVAFGSDADDDTLQLIAQCGNGSFSSGTVEDIVDVYMQLARYILEATFQEQRIVTTGGINTTLDPSSYIIFNYSAPSVSTGLLLNIETNEFNNNIAEGNFSVPEDAELLEANLISYSRSWWTSNVSIFNTNWKKVFNLADYGSDYLQLGDPYVINIPIDLAENGENKVRVQLGLSPTNYTGGSNKSKIIYTILKERTSFSPIKPKADGCIWILKFNDGQESSIKVPQYYTGTRLCYYNESVYNTNDAIDEATYALLEKMDINSDGIIDTKFTEQDLEVTTNRLKGVPFAWSTEAQVRVWR
ncbi:MAG: LamG-like jellyroll fold domain-containing protein [archaeon]